VPGYIPLLVHIQSQMNQSTRSNTIYLRSILILALFYNLHVSQVHTQNFSLGWGVGDTEAIYNLCLILKIML
jgi:hypothetical protein